jgi:hypothetical protein
MKKEKIKKDRPLDLHSYLVGKLRAATRKWPPFNQCKSSRKIEVSVEYIEQEGKKWLVSTILEEKFGLHVGEKIWTEVYKKMASRERRVMYCCEACGRLFFDYEFLPVKKSGELKKTPMMAIDHIAPVVPVDSIKITWDEYISRMFCTIDGLQCICNHKGFRDETESCHHIKTRNEQTARLGEKIRRNKKYN